MENWNHDFKQIAICYNDCMIQIKTDQPLLSFLEEKGNGSIALSKHIHEQYKTMFQKPLDISQDSLAIEILIHVYMEQLTKTKTTIAKILPKKIASSFIKCMEKLHQHTQIIDCGEKEVDSNRIVFDTLAPYHKIIYGILRDKA